MKLGVLTSGGDCPGLNAVLRAIARRGAAEPDVTLIGFKDAWRGVIENDWIPLDVGATRGILPQGGTILGTSRVQPYGVNGGLLAVQKRQEEMGIDGFIVIGGEGSLSCARDLNADGVHCIGVPKTIDNDISATEVTFGFDTAVSIATAAIDRLHTTAESHDRIILVEVMGRHVGHIAYHAGIAGGAAAILIPEIPFDIDVLVDELGTRHEHDRYSSIVVVAEGAIPKPGSSYQIPPVPQDEFGHQKLGGVTVGLAGALERRLGIETRPTILGYVQRGGTPTAFDRFLATRFGRAALEYALEGQWGTMPALQADNIVRVALSTAVSELKTVDVTEFLATTASLCLATSGTP